jgi:hypothetical protein
MGLAPDPAVEEILSEGSKSSAVSARGGDAVRVAR